MSERIFDGLKVIDCASFIAGPAAATVIRRNDQSARIPVSSISFFIFADSLAM